MRFFHPLVGTSLLIAAILTSCSLQSINPTADTGVVATIVAGTLAAFTQSEQVTPGNSPAPSTQMPPTAQQVSTQVPVATIVLTKTPTYTLPPTVTVGSTLSPTPGLGSIAGSIIGYPYGPTPGLAIVAFGQEPPNRYWYLITGAGTSYYSMDGYITTGHYQVVVYDASGHTGGCTTVVQVLNNQTVNCDITNWGGGYPAKPSNVPTP